MPDINYYALTGSPSGLELTVAFHFNVAADPWTNLAGKTLKQCLTDDPGAPAGSTQVPWLKGTAIDAQLATRDLLEIVEIIQFGVDAAPAAKKAKVETRAANLQGSLAREVHERYWAYGYEGTV